jgi:hypothetical protein
MNGAFRPQSMTYVLCRTERTAQFEPSVIHYGLTVTLIPSWSLQFFT